MRRHLLTLALVGCGHTPINSVDAAGDDGDGGPTDGEPTSDGDPTIDAPPDMPPTGPTNVMFVTSTSHTGNLGGTAGADAICAARATAGGLDGTFRAYLGTSAGTAASRIAGARGWVRVDGKPFADTAADVAAGLIFYPSRVDERGDDVAMGDAMTGTDETGATSASTCNNFASNGGMTAYGTPTAGGAAFGFNGTGSCSVPRRLYCFGVDNVGQVDPPPPTGRRAFVAYWVPGTGRAAADTACATAASAASLAGNFKALLGTTTETAASRFSAAGANWVRHDGVEVAANPAALLAGELTAPIIYEAGGAFAMAANGYVVTGGFPNIMPGNAETCVDWTSTSVNDSNRAGTITSTVYAFSRASLLCGSAPRAVYCLQQ